MQWVTTRLLADKLSLSDRTIRDWCMGDPSLAHKTAEGVWQINVRALAENRGVDLTDLLLLLQSPDTDLVKAAHLAMLANIPRRTVAHWCKTRPAFAIRVGTVWYVDLGRLGVTRDEIRDRRRAEQEEGAED